MRYQAEPVNEEKERGTARVKCSARQPVSWMVGRSRGGSQTGFLSKIGRQNVEIIAETPFLDGWQGLRNRVSSPNRA
ncbi:hypothetical protein QUB56_17600 [Microcoleus sp. AR_TQ3_B6]|uniref:hypothetical protein n=1 Tax=Microcoleus sp. AR_TQ3_B6 TaxID=3055284 RepID=UPI002FD0FAAE